MIERLLETWLTKANERSFQIPFAHWLAFTGHTVVHVSRHCAMELGKDVVAIAPDGVPCAYQLKGVGGGRLTLAKWREDLSRQLHPLVHCQLVHPSLPLGPHHRSYIVINGDFDEEVQREIDDFNRASIAAGQPERTVQTIVKGQLFRAFRELQSDFWATNLYDLKTYLEIFLEDGNGMLPKEKLAKLFLDALPFEARNDRAPSRDECSRALAGCAVICASAVCSFTTAQNHLAEFEAWTLLWCYTLALAQRWQLPLSDVAYTVTLATDAAYTSLARLCDELVTRETLIEGDPMPDRFVYEIRITHLLGLMGLYGLMMQSRIAAGKIGDFDVKHLDFVRHFCDKHKDTLRLWGEYAVPQFLAWNFFRQTYDATLEPEVTYARLIEAICRMNQRSSNIGLANPYYDAETILPYQFNLAGHSLDDSFPGHSFYLEGLMHLFVRCNFKMEMKRFFPALTRIGLCSFQPESDWQFFLQRNWNRGTLTQRFLVPPHRWSELRKEAAEDQGSSLPSLLKTFPLGYLAMLLIMPYRGTPNGLRWLASQIDEQARDKSWLWC